jgi:heat shock protein HslJ
MVALFAVWARRVAVFSATWFLALPLAFADPLGDPATSAADPLSNELEGHLWHIGAVGPKRTWPHRSILPAGNDGSDAYVIFENGDIRGSLGCGKLVGEYSLLGDRVTISNPRIIERKGCGIEFLERADEVISALRGAVHLKRDEDTFKLFDEQKTYSISLDLLNPGSDLSELSGSFWQLVSLEGNPIAEPTAEVRLNRGLIEVVIGEFHSGFSFRYRMKKFEVNGPFSTRSSDNGVPPPLLEAFGQALQKISSYSTDGEELAAMDASGRHVMLLKRIRPTGLEYRYWHIAAYGLEGWLNPTTGFPQLKFISFVQGQVQGNGGCAVIEGHYTLIGDSVTIDAGDLSGSRTCTTADQNEQRIVLHTLNKASRVKRDGTRMLLQDAQGNTNIVLEPYAQQTPRRDLASGLTQR